MIECRGAAEQGDRSVDAAAELVGLKVGVLVAQRASDVTNSVTMSPERFAVRLKKLREARGLTQEALAAKAKTAARVSPDWKRGGMIRTCPVCGRWRARSALGCLNSWTETERPGVLLRPMAHEITCSKKLRSTPALPGVPGPAPAPRRRTGDVRGGRGSERAPATRGGAPRRRPPRERPHRHPGPGAVHA